MNIWKYFYCSIFLFIVISCTTTSEVEGEGGFETMFQSKRYKEAVKDRDSLLAVTRLLQTDTFRLKNQNRTFLKEIRRITGEYAFLKKDYSSLDSSCTSLNNQYTALKNEQLKLKAEYKSYSDSMEKKILALSEELKSRSEELNAKSSELNNKSDELKSKSDELNTKSKELSIRPTVNTALPDQSGNTGKTVNPRDQTYQKLEALFAEQDSLTSGLYNSLNISYRDYNPEDLSVTRSEGKVRVSINNKLLFKPGTMSIDDKGRKTLKKLALLLNRNDDIVIAVEGHTDSIPVKNINYKDNWDLSAVRATSVARVLNEDYDISPIRLIPVGRGEFFPIASNEDLQGRAKNRRVEIILSPNPDEIYRMMGKK